MVNAIGSICRTVERLPQPPTLSQDRPALNNPGVAAATQPAPPTNPLAGLSLGTCGFVDRVAADTTGWGSARALASPGNGFIYAIQANGDLLVAPFRRAQKRHGQR